MDSEIWKDIIGYEGLYMISNKGRVKSYDKWKNNHSKKQFVKGRIMKNQSNCNYEKIVLKKDCEKGNFLIHRLVAMHFIDNPYNKRCVNHIDGNKLNNDVSNLEWMTHSENNKHAYETGLKDIEKARESAKKAREAYKKKLYCPDLDKYFDSMSEASVYLGVSVASVSRSVNIKRPILNRNTGKTVLLLIN